MICLQFVAVPNPHKHCRQLPKKSVVHCTWSVLTFLLTEVRLQLLVVFHGLPVVALQGHLGCTLC